MTEAARVRAPEPRSVADAAAALRRRRGRRRRRSSTRRATGLAARGLDAAAGSPTPRSRPSRPPPTASPGWRPTPRALRELAALGRARSTPAAGSARSSALILQIGFGEYLAQLAGGIPMSQTEIVRPHDLGLGAADLAAFRTPEVEALIADGNTDAARARLVALMAAAGGAASFGATGLDDDFEMIRDQFRRFADDRVVPFAHDWHLKDELIPIEIVEEMGALGRLRPDHPRGIRRRRPVRRPRCASSPRSCRAATSASARSAPAPRSRPS